MEVKFNTTFRKGGTQRLRNVELTLEEVDQLINEIEMSVGLPHIRSKGTLLQKIAIDLMEERILRGGE